MTDFLKSIRQAIFGQSEQERNEEIQDLAFALKEINQKADGKKSENDIMQMTINEISKEYVQKSIKNRDERKKLLNNLDENPQKYQKTLITQDNELEDLIHTTKLRIIKDTNSTHLGDFQQLFFYKTTYPMVGSTQIVQQTKKTVRQELNENIPSTPDSQSIEKYNKYYEYLYNCALYDQKYMNLFTFVGCKNINSAINTFSNDKIYQKFQVDVQMDQTQFFSDKVRKFAQSYKDIIGNQLLEIQKIYYSKKEK